MINKIFVIFLKIIYFLNIYIITKKLNHNAIAPCKFVNNNTGMMPPCTIQVHVNRLATQNRMDKITKSEEKKHIEISYNKTRYKLHVIISISCTSFLKTNHFKIQLKCFTTANYILRFIKLIELHDQIIYRIVVSKTTPTP